MSTLFQELIVFNFSVMGKTPKIGCIVSTLSFLAFFALVFFEFLSHHEVEGKLGYVRGGKYFAVDSYMMSNCSSTKVECSELFDIPMTC